LVRPCVYIVFSRWLLCILLALIGVNLTHAKSYRDSLIGAIDHLEPSIEQIKALELLQRDYIQSTEYDLAFEASFQMLNCQIR